MRHATKGKFPRKAVAELKQFDSETWETVIRAIVIYLDHLETVDNISSDQLKGRSRKEVASEINGVREKAIHARDVFLEFGDFIVAN